MNRLALLLSMPTLSAVSVLTLVGCAAAIDVRSLGTGGGAAAYELRGENMAALDAQAQALCPAGHTVLRQWQRQHRQALASGSVSDWVAGKPTLQRAVSGVLDDGEAQLMVQCQATAH